VAEVFKSDAAKVDKIFRVSGTLVLLENDRQVDELGDSSCVSVVFRK